MTRSGRARTGVTWCGKAFMQIPGMRYRGSSLTRTRSAMKISARFLDAQPEAEERLAAALGVLADMPIHKASGDVLDGGLVARAEVFLSGDGSGCHSLPPPTQ